MSKKPIRITFLSKYYKVPIHKTELPQKIIFGKISYARPNSFGKDDPNLLRL